MHHTGAGAAAREAQSQQVAGSQLRRINDSAPLGVGRERIAARQHGMRVERLQPGRECLQASLPLVQEMTRADGERRCSTLQQMFPGLDAGRGALHASSQFLAAPSQCDDVAGQRMPGAQRQRVHPRGERLQRPARARWQ